MSIEWHSSREFWMGESEPPAKEKYIGVQPSGKARDFQGLIQVEFGGLV